MNYTSLDSPITSTQFRRHTASVLGQPCIESFECVSGAQCLFKVCACPPNTIANVQGNCVFEKNTMFKTEQQKNEVFLNYFY